MGILKKFAVIFLSVILITPMLSIEVKADEKLDAIDQYVKLNEDTLAGAAVAVITNGQIVEKTYGYADIEKKIKVDRNTVFEWGSCSKLLVWTSVMQLAEQGKLDLNKDIREYLPEKFLTKLKFNKSITMLNLMNHNAGWADEWRDLMVLNSEKIVPLSEALQKHLPQQIYEPGTTVAYSNFGPALAGYIVGIISGKPFWQFVQENILKPLNMTHTAIGPSQSDKDWVRKQRNIVKGYSTNRQYMKTERVYFSLYPAASTIGTVDDMAKFVRALMPEKGEKSPLFKSTEALHNMLNPTLFYSDETPRISHGFFSFKHEEDTLGHNGTTSAFSANITFSPKSRKAICILTNTSNESVLMRGLPDIIFGKKQYSYGGKLPSIKVPTGVYFNSRRYVKSFSSLLTWENPYIVKQVSDNEISIGGVRCQQVAPFYFVGDGISAHGLVENGKIVGFSVSPSTDIVPKPIGEVITIYALFMLVLLGAVHFTISLFVELLGWGVRKVRKQPREKSTLKWMNMWIGIGYLIVVFNTIMLSCRSLDLANYNSLIPHFLINGLFLPFSTAYIVMIFKQSNIEKREKGNAVAATLFCCALSVTIILADLWR